MLTKLIMPGGYHLCYNAEGTAWLLLHTCNLDNVIKLSLQSITLRFLITKAMFLSFRVLETFITGVFAWKTNRTPRVVVRMRNVEHFDLKPRLATNMLSKELEWKVTLNVNQPISHIFSLDNCITYYFVGHVVPLLGAYWGPVWYSWAQSQ